MIIRNLSSLIHVVFCLYRDPHILFVAAGVMTGSGQTYVVVQEGDNISFVPAEMVQGDLGAAVNGGQVSPCSMFHWETFIRLHHT